LLTCTSFTVFASDERGRHKLAVAHTSSGKEDVVNNKKIWFVTGAGRGMGADFVKAALAAGHAVVATGRNSDAVPRRWDSRTTC